MFYNLPSDLIFNEIKLNFYSGLFICQIILSNRFGTGFTSSEFNLASRSLRIYKYSYVGSEAELDFSVDTHCLIWSTCLNFYKNVKVNYIS